MGKVCETCGQTRWEGRQVDGYVTSLREENERLRAALIVAADDLAKAANQFAGLREMEGQSWPIVNNPETFAEKAERARAAALHWKDREENR